MTLVTEQARDRVLQRRTLAGAALAVVVGCAGLAAQRLTGVTQGGACMPSCHLLMELIAIIMAALVVVIAWHRLSPDDDTSANILICGFTIVAACDLLHALSVAGMPPLPARGDASHGMFFWLISRSVGLASLAMLAWRWPLPASRGFALFAGTAASVAIASIGLYHFSAWFDAGQGVAAFRAGYETGLSLLAILVAAVFWSRAVRSSESKQYLLAMSAFVLGAGGLMFDPHAVPGGFQNVFGHGFTIVAYALLVQATFLSSFHAPYRALRDAERQLRDSEERFRALTNMSSDWYWEQDAELRFIATTGQSDDLGGISSKEHRLLRRWELPGTEIIGQSWEEHKALLAGRQPFQDLILKRTVPGQPARFISVSGEPIFDNTGRFTGYRGVTRDITARVLAEQQAQDSSRRLQLAIENLNESIAVMDSEDRIVVSNRYFRELNGNTHLVDVGRRYDEHLRAGIALGNYPEAIGREEEWLAARFERRRTSGTHELQRQNGTWLRVTDQMLPDGGTISFGLDITALKNSELALRAANEDLEKRVAARTAEIEAFTYSVSHDLRAPIRAIDGYSALLQMAPALLEDSESRDLLAKIRASTKRMNTLLQDLLDLSLYSTRELQKGAVNMRAEVDSVLAEMQNTANGAAIEIGNLPDCTGDQILLQQVWINLIGNALKYSAKHRAPVIRIGFKDGAYFVNDNGIGFEPLYAGKLFKLFSRLHHERDYSGMGIGLAIVKRIVERHGGIVTAEGSIGQGATFSFLIPA